MFHAVSVFVMFYLSGSYWVFLLLDVHEVALGRTRLDRRTVSFCSALFVRFFFCVSLGFFCGFRRVVVVVVVFPSRRRGKWRQKHLQPFGRTRWMRRMERLPASILSLFFFFPHFLFFFLSFFLSFRPRFAAANERSSIATTTTTTATKNQRKFHRSRRLSSPRTFQKEQSRNKQTNKRTASSARFHCVIDSARGPTGRPRKPAKKTRSDTFKKKKTSTS